MKIILHIGQYKTGSTSIQKYLLNARSELLKSKILYPESIIDRGAHFAFSDKIKASSAKKPQHRFNKQQGEFATLFDEIEEHQPDILLISSESLCASSLKSFNEKLMLKAWQQIAMMFEGHDVEIVYYYRRQDTAIESRITQLIKGEFHWHDLECRSFFCDSLDLNYQWFNDKLLSFFGKTIPIPFLKSEFHGQNLIQDFCFHAGLPFFPGKMSNADQNTSPTAHTIAYLNEINAAHLPEQVKQGLRDLVWLDAEKEDKKSPGANRAKYLRKKQRESIMDFYAASNTSFLNNINAPSNVKNYFSDYEKDMDYRNTDLRGARFLELLARYKIGL
jgi:hypothetical protein